MKHWLVFPILCLILIATTSSAIAASPLQITFDSTVPQGLRPSIQQQIIQARQIVDSQGHFTFSKPVTIEWAATATQVEQRLHMRPEHLAAAAIPDEGRIIINGQQFRQSSPGEQQVTLTHEFVHLFIGAFVVDRTPLWLEEGLAMHISGDLEQAASSWQLTLAYSTGRLLPIDELTGSFPSDPAQRALAYRQAYSLTSFLLKQHNPVNGAAGMLEELADPVRGPRLTEWLDDLPLMRAYEAQWKKTLHDFWSWVAVLGSGGVLWAIITAMFLYAYYRRKRANRQTVQKWHDEDAWMESVPDEHYQNWGDEEDEDDKQ